MIYGSFLDIFQSPILLKFEKHEKTATYLGVLFSLTIIALLSITFIQSDVFYKSSPNVYDITEALEERAFINFNKILAISIEDDNGNAYNDPQIFEIKVTNYLLEATDNGNGGFAYITNSTKETHICTTDDIPANIYEKLGFSNKNCVGDSFDLKGLWNENSLKYLDISLILCNNITTQGKCKSLEEIQNFFFRKSFNIYFSDLSIDTSNYEKPLSFIIHNEFYMVDLIIRKILNVYLKQIQVQTDDGFLLSNYNEINDIIFDSKDLDMFKFDTLDDEQPLFQCLIFSSQSAENIQRVYQKITDALSNVGGMANILMIFGFLFTSVEKSLQLQKKIMNALYSFQELSNKQNTQNTQKTLNNLNDIKRSDTIYGKKQDSELNSSQTRKDASKIIIEHKEDNENLSEIELNDTKGKNNPQTVVLPKSMEFELNNPKDSTRNFIEHKDDNKNVSEIKLNDTKERGTHKARTAILPEKIEDELIKDPSRNFIEHKEDKEIDSEIELTDAKGKGQHTPITAVLPKKLEAELKEKYISRNFIEHKEDQEGLSEIELYDSKGKDQNAANLSRPKIFPMSFKKIQLMNHKINETGNEKKEETLIFKRDETLSSQKNENLKNNFNPLKIISTIKKLKSMTLSKTEKIKKAEKFLDISNRQPKMNFNLYEYIILYFKRLFHRKISEKEKLFLKGVDLYDKELDIVGILRKLQEIEKIKIILFNKEQLTLFNLLEKPLICLTGKEDLQRLSTLSPSRQMTEMIQRNSRIDPEQLKKAFDYFETLKRNAQLSDIDKKLTDLVDKNLNQIANNF